MWGSALNYHTNSFENSATKRPPPRSQDDKWETHTWHRFNSTEKTLKTKLPLEYSQQKVDRNLWTKPNQVKCLLEQKYHLPKDF